MVTNLKLSDLLAELTKKATVAYPKPLYAYKSFAILVPDNIVVDWRDLLHFDSWDKDMVQYEYVLHGHDLRLPCRNDHFCHLLGYRPSSDLNPKFINAFYRKWSYFNVETKPVELDLNL